MADPKYTQWITAEGQAQIKQWIAEGKYDKDIAKEIGITPQLLNVWRKKYPPIKNALIRLVDKDTHQVIDRHDITNPGGHKRALANDPYALAAAIEDYSQRRADQKLPLTVSSLCLFLGISKDTFNKYLKEDVNDNKFVRINPFTGKEEGYTISGILRMAKMRIESDLEDRMLTNKGSVVGIIFDLKNHHGYTDTKNIENNQVITKRDETMDVDARIKELLARQSGDAPLALVK